MENKTWKSTQEHFNRVAKDAGDATYEDRRWKQNQRTEQQFESTKKFIEVQVLPQIQSSKYIMELGPGPGTWTRLLSAANTAASFILTDISIEMLKRASASFAPAQVEIREGAFLQVPINAAEVDTFFSSRALEYVGDTNEAAHRIYTALCPGGFGCVITKTPKHIINALRGYKPSPLHQNQIAPKKLIKALRSNGFTNIHAYPVTFSFPLLKSAAADRLLDTLFSKYQLNPLSTIFTESYAVTFTKPIETT